MTVNHPTFGTMCEICYMPLTPDTCAVDTDGEKWDVCPGKCATEAGITEGQPPAHLLDQMLAQVDERPYDDLPLTREEMGKMVELMRRATREDRLQVGGEAIAALRVPICNIEYKPGSHAVVLRLGRPL